MKPIVLAAMSVVLIAGCTPHNSTPDIPASGSQSVSTRAAAAAFRTGIPGNSGFATTKDLWDPVLGLGTPIGAYKLVGAADPAGPPGWSSNP